MAHDHRTPADRLKNAPDGTDDQAEQVIWTGNYSAKAMIGWWIATGFATVVLPIVVGFIPLPELRGVIWWVVVLLLAAAWIWFLGLAVVRKLSQYYEVTSQRLKHREGILFRKANRIELIDIDDVMYKQGPVQALMGIGTITITSSDASHPTLIMVGIAEVKSVADLIDDARRAERRKRGLHIEAI